jgi:hypothetical protein
MLVEILLGIRQIIMGYGTKHGTDFNWFSKGFGTFWNKVFLLFWPAIRPANGNSARRPTGKDVLGTQNAFGNLRPQWPAEDHRKRDRFRGGHPSKNSWGVHQLFMDDNDRGHGMLRPVQPRPAFTPFRCLFFIVK